jgi:hypothetical protein
MRARSLLLTSALLAIPVPAFADPAPNAVTDWAAIVQPAIHNATAPRSPATSQVLHAMVILAVYDAVVAIEGGSKPFAAQIRAWQGADVRAAVAAAAYLTARGRVLPSQFAYLDQQYATYLATIPESTAKSDGIAVGQAAAAAILEMRADDGFDNVVLYQCSSIPPPPGEFEPNAGCPTQPSDPQPVDVRLGQVRPFTFDQPSRFRPNGPYPLQSRAYSRDFIEVRDYGRSESALRTAEQTDIVYFWAEHTYVHWNRNLIALALERELPVAETARLFAMAHTAAADAVIAGFEAKYHYTFWRPRTAIPRADTDGNRHTPADPAWTPLLSVNHPEYPSAHGFWSTALLTAVRAFFRTNRVTWTIVTSKAAVPQVVQTERTYETLTEISREIADARVWAGLHWRNSMHEGNRLGRRVARHAASHFFGRTGH